MVAIINELHLDSARVNVNGGAIALGHPIGASGARILTTLVHEMKRRGPKRGVAWLCLGGGIGVAIAIEAAQLVHPRAANIDRPRDSPCDRGSAEAVRVASVHTKENVEVRDHSRRNARGGQPRRSASGRCVAKADKRV